MKNKKWLAIAAGMLTAITLASCGGKEKTVEGKTNLKIAFVEAGFGRQFLLDWEEDYNAKHPDEMVHLVLDGDAQMTENVITRLQNSNPRNLPDIFMVLNTNWQPWAVQNYLEPLDEVYETEVSSGVTVKDYMVDNLKTFGKVKDNYWALPWSAGPSGIVYNAGMFEQFGWEVPKTVSELLTLCETIKTTSGGAIAPFAWSGATGGYWDFLTFQWWAQIEGEEGWNEFWKFESPNVYKQEGRLKSLQAFADLIDNGDGTAKNSVPGAFGLKFMEAQMAFVNGEAAMMANGCWLENEMKNSLPKNFKMRLMETPAIEGAKTEGGQVKKINYNACGDFIIVPKRAAQKELAKKFLAYTCTEDACKIFTRSAGGIRPFKYTPSAVEGITDFTKGCAEMWENETNVFMTSNNVMFYQNNCNSWPGYGSPYSRLIQEQDSPETVMNTCYNYVNSNWAEFQRMANTGGF